MRLARTSLLFTACLIGTACDIPTELPIIQQRWVLPVDDVALDQVELLPPSVSIVGDEYAAPAQAARLAIDLRERRPHEALLALDDGERHAEGGPAAGSRHCDRPYAD